MYNIIEQIVAKSLNIPVTFRDLYSHKNNWADCFNLLDYYLNLLRSDNNGTTNKRKYNAMSRPPHV